MVLSLWELDFCLFLFLIRLFILVPPPTITATPSEGENVGSNGTGWNAKGFIGSLNFGVSGPYPHFNLISLSLNRLISPYCGPYRARNTGYYHNPHCGRCEGDLRGG